MSYEYLAVMAVFALFYSLVAGRVERLPISGPIVYIVFGAAVGPLGLGLLVPSISPDNLRLIAELTLALVLFTDASGTNLNALRKSQQLPRRLLLIGLPLTILLGIGAGQLLLPGLPLIELAILATILAPTDAALGNAVVNDSRVLPEVRQGLSVESGLNDGICVPILFVLLAIAGGDMSTADKATFALRLVVQEIGIGVVVGLLVTRLAALVIRYCWNRNWISDIWRQVIVVALAFACFSIAQFLHGSGFIAAFIGGLLFGSLSGDHNKALVQAAEGLGYTMGMVTWVLFGAAVVLQSMSSFEWQILIYAVLSLTVVRILPVFVSLTGLGMPTQRKLFIGWFGPRGLASIVFTVVVLNEKIPGGHIMAEAVVCTVILSILAHGSSANPTIAALAAWRERSQGENEKQLE